MQLAILLLISLQLSFVLSTPLELTPRCGYTGSIVVKEYSANTTIGWMGGLAYGSFAYTTNAAQKTPLSFTYSHDPNTPLEISVADTAPLHYVGAMGDTLDLTRNGNAFYLVRTNPVPYGPSQIVGHSAASGPRQSQTLIWKFNPVTNELSGTWVNPDGTVLPTIWYIPPGGTNIRVSAHPNLILQKVRLYWEA